MVKIDRTRSRYWLVFWGNPNRKPDAWLYYGEGKALENIAYDIERYCVNHSWVLMGVYPGIVGGCPKVLKTSCELTVEDSTRVALELTPGLCDARLIGADGCILGKVS